MVWDDEVVPGILGTAILLATNPWEIREKTKVILGVSPLQRGLCVTGWALTPGTYCGVIRWLVAIQLKDIKAAAAAAHAAGLEAEAILAA